MKTPAQDKTDAEAFALFRKEKKSEKKSPL